MNRNSIYSRKRIYRVFTLLSLFLLLPVTYGTKLASICLALTIALMAFPVLVIAIGRADRITLRPLSVGFAFAAYAVWMLVILLISDWKDGQTYVRVLQLAGCVFAFYFAALLKWKAAHLALVKTVLQLVTIAGVIVWLVKGLPFSGYMFFFKNANTYASVMLCWFVFLVMTSEGKKDLAFSAVSLFLLFVSGARAAMLSAIVFIVFGCILRRKQKDGRGIDSRKLYLLLILELAAVLVFVFVYTRLVGTNIGSALQSLSVRYFGKNLFSGRERLWHGLIDKIAQRPLWGYGLNTLPGDLIDTHLSAHNTFLQTAIQMGLIGLLLLIRILVNIFRRCTEKPEDPFAAYCIAFLFAIIVHESFEVCLMQNMTVCGMEMWFLLGLGCRGNARGRIPKAKIGNDRNEIASL